MHSTPCNLASQPAAEQAAHALQHALQVAPQAAEYHAETWAHPKTTACLLAAETAHQVDMHYLCGQQPGVPQQTARPCTHC